jgi:formylglycine-generating enzyme required for sulfatase activity
MEFTPVADAPVLFAKHEVRVSDWQAFLTATGYAWSYKPHFEQGADHPVVGITLQDAIAFCNWLTEKERKEGTLNSNQSYRLPSPEEWDAAVGLRSARGANLSVEEKLEDDKKFPWGVEWPPPAKSGNFADGEIPGYEDGFPFTSPVGRFAASASGLFDLAGNVWEWCWNPSVQAQQTAVLRGGSWAYFRRECLAAGFRYQVPATMRMPTIGFRCVLEDRDRTSALIAAAKAAASQERTERREQLLGGSVDKAAIEALRKSMTLTPSSGLNLPDVANLTPAAPGRSYLNHLGMDFVPLGESNILMGASEVRVQDIQAWLAATARAWPNKPPFNQGDTHAAAGVTWHEAQAFCEWLTGKDQAAGLIPRTAKYRLPTDLEWSRAAGLPNEMGADPAQRDRGNRVHYPWSAEGEFPPRGSSTNLDAARVPGYSDRYAYTSPVNLELPGPTGFVGLGGNVAEWCADEWPNAPGERVIRGGSWQSFDKEQLLTSARRHAPADKAMIDVGFRCTLELPAGP